MIKKDKEKIKQPFIFYHYFLFICYQVSLFLLFIYIGIGNQPILIKMLDNVKLTRLEVYFSYHYWQLYSLNRTYAIYEKSTNVSLINNRIVNRYIFD